MKLILMGTPKFVVPIFEKISCEHEIIAVFTRAPKPVGRHHILTKSPVHEWAKAKGINVFVNINKLQNYEMAESRPDFIIVAAYGVILKQEVLDFAHCINIHPSLLPKYRGPSPIATAVMNGDSESGVCLMNMAAEVDSGDILMCQKFSIGENDTAANVEARVAEIAGPMVLSYLDDPAKYPPVPQAGDPTFTRKITTADEIIDWARSAPDIHNQVRAIGGRTIVDGIDVKILETRVENGELRVLRLQPAGKKTMSWRDFENGRKNAVIARNP